MYMDDAVIAGLLTVGASVVFVASIAVFVWHDMHKKNSKQH